MPIGLNKTINNNPFPQIGLWLLAKGDIVLGEICRGTLSFRGSRRRKTKLKWKVTLTEETAAVARTYRLGGCISCYYEKCNVKV